MPSAPDILSATNCQVWRAPASLMRIVPPSGPRHRPDLRRAGYDGNVLTRHGMEYNTWQSVEWHVDWASWFVMLCTRGHGTLHVGRRRVEVGLGKRPADGVITEPGPHDRVHLKRGSLLCLYGMAPHQLTTRRCMAFINLGSFPASRDAPPPPRATIEDDFVTYIMENKTA